MRKKITTLSVTFYKCHFRWLFFLSYYNIFGLYAITSKYIKCNNWIH